MPPQVREHDGVVGSPQVGDDGLGRHVAATDGGAMTSESDVAVRGGAWIGCAGALLALWAGCAPAEQPTDEGPVGETQQAVYDAGSDAEPIPRGPTPGWSM